ncbi:YutD family protein [Lacticaseibacillus chiayiensis]|uniref:YutD family protein n=1 Tax=Lacticaseibacillus chiayiensis TaxID=2100821 RepID=UPI001010F7E6|nr:YutD family protein [Lacticaseibacillus chiayiensis]RXT56800.1 transcriptional regulator [Lacticaseibacillus chiayiensis]
MGEREKLSEQIDVALTPDTTKEMRVVKVGQDLVTIDGRRYYIVKNHRDAFDLDRLNERYNDILDKYDYIVGDWGYDQLRLRGFYKDDRRGASKDQQISTLEDYLYEYCNFGCAYFVLACLDKPVTKVADRRHDRERKSTTGKTVHGQQSKPTQRQHHGKRKPYAKVNKPYTEKTTRAAHFRGEQAKTVNQTQPRKRHFTIRQRETNKK